MRGLCTENDNNQKFWAHLMSITVCSVHKDLIDEGRDLSQYERFAFNLLCHFKVETRFSASLLTMHIPTCVTELKFAFCSKINTLYDRIEVSFL